VSANVAGPANNPKTIVAANLFILLTPEFRQDYPAFGHAAKPHVETILATTTWTWHEKP
jgi:hypothetical protein